jgi:alanine-glyoxylate transaminase/serine-glyoxylate transaminase/serine-pyruvate transaminase
MTRSFHPPLRTLMGPGPSDVHPRVLAALARPTIGHLDPAFVGMMDEVKAMLQSAFRTANPCTLPLSAPGSAAMEAAFVNVVESGDTVVVAVNGVFGARMVEIARRLGAEVVRIDDAWGTAVDLEKVDEALRRHPGTKVLAFVHAETSTGVRSDAAALCALARAHGALSIVDAVTSLGGIPVEVDTWGADVVYAGSQKCLSCPPGLAPITLSPNATDAVRRRRSPVVSWFLDLSLVMAYWGGEGARVYHHTAPINALYGLHEALVLLEEEGLERAWYRHAELHSRLVAGIEALGLEMLVAPADRLPQLNAIRVPPGVDEAAVRRRLLDEFDLEIGAGLGTLAGKIWRVGLMGYGARAENVERFLAAMRAVM